MKKETIIKSIAIVFVGLFACTTVAVAARTAVFLANVQQTTVVGSCNSGTTASSTLFDIPNPFSSGSSTIMWFNLSGTQGATTTDIVVGTSTTSFVSQSATGVVATSTLKETYLGASVIATGTAFSLTAGATFSFNPGTYINNVLMVLGPTEHLLGMSTSTYGTARNGGTTTPTIQVPASCTYKAIIVQ